MLGFLLLAVTLAAQQMYAPRRALVARVPVVRRRLQDINYRSFGESEWQHSKDWSWEAQVTNTARRN